MKLMDYLPPEIYQNSGETRTIQEAFQPEVELLWRARDCILKQLNPATATWGLALWERALGITFAAEKDVALRRVIIAGKVRGRETVTRELVRGVCESFTGTPVEVRELPPESKLKLRFSMELTQPPDLESLRTAILEILPAHLALEYVITVESFRKLPSTLRMGGVMACVTTMPLRCAEDELSFRNTLRAGGRAAVRSSVPIPSSAEDRPVTRKLRGGGKGAIHITAPARVIRI